MTDKTTTLILKGKIGYEEEISVAQAAQIIAFLSAGDGVVASLGNGALPANDRVPATASKLVENPRDAIVRSGAKTNPEKIVALAAYVLQDGGDTVKSDAIKSQFQRAREAVPAKFARDLGVAIAAGWMAEGDGGELYLTSKVEGIFEDGFKFTKSSAMPRNRANKSPKAKSGKPESFADIDSFDSTMAGYLPYSKMKSEKDRMLWVLVYMRDVHNRKSLTNKEIEWITDHIGTGIPNSNVTSAFVNAKNRGYAIRSTQDQSIKVTDSGVAYLAGLAASSDA